MRYPFVAIEGLDGSGKTTLRKGLFRLWDGLQGVTPLCVLGTNHLDLAAAEDLLRGKYTPGSVPSDAFLHAMVTDKHATHTQLVQPNLDSRPVIADRWIVSDLVLLEARFGLPALKAYAQFTTRLTRPADVTIYLEAPAGMAVRRSSARSGDATRADWDRLDIQDQAARSYAAIIGNAADYPLLGDLVRIDAAAEPWTVLLNAWDHLIDRGWLPRT